MRVNEALERYVLQLRADGRSVHTISQVERHIRLFDDWSGGGAAIETLDHEDIARFLTSECVTLRADGQPRKPTSANALRSSLRTFFAFVHAAGYTRLNPARLVRRAVCSDPLPKFLKQADQDRLMATLAEATGEVAMRDRVLFELMLKTGARIGSTLGIRIEDVDLERGEIVLRRVKFAREHTVYIGETLMNLLRDLIGDRKEGFLFPGKGDAALSARHVARRLKAWSERAMVPVLSPHQLRHAFATALYRRTGDLLLTKKALGHASLASTAIYAAADHARLKSLMAG